MLIKTPKNGMTLIELLITLAIISILLLIAVPSLIFLVQQNRLKAVAEEVYQGLEYARSEALKQNIDAFFYVQPGSTWCFGSRIGSTCNCATSGSCTLQTVSNTGFSSSILLTTTGFSASTARFSGSRGTATQSGTIGASLGSYSIQLSVTKMGRIMICSDNVWGYGGC